MFVWSGEGRRPHVQVTIEKDKVDPYERHDINYRYKNDVQNPEYPFELGAFYYRSKKFEYAESYLEQARKKSSELLVHLKNNPATKFYAQLHIAVSPTVYVSSLALLLNILENKGDYERARLLLQEYSTLKSLLVPRPFSDFPELDSFEERKKRIDEELERLSALETKIAQVNQLMKQAPSKEGEKAYQALVASSDQKEENTIFTTSSSVSYTEHQKKEEQEYAEKKEHYKKELEKLEELEESTFEIEKSLAKIKKTVESELPLAVKNLFETGAKQWHDPRWIRSAQNMWNRNSSKGHSTGTAEQSRHSSAYDFWTEDAGSLLWKTQALDQQSPESAQWFRSDEALYSLSKSDIDFLEDQEDKGSIKVAGKLGPLSQNITYLPLPEGYMIDPDSIRFENLTIASYDILYSKKGEVALFIRKLPRDEIYFSYTVKVFDSKKSNFKHYPKEAEKYFRPHNKSQISLGSYNQEQSDSLYSNIQEPYTRALQMSLDQKSQGIYTKDHNALDAYLNPPSGISAQEKFNRMQKLFEQRDLPSELQGLGADCDCWSERFVHLARANGLPARLVLGYQNSDMNGLLKSSGSDREVHGWVEVWDSTENSWKPLNVTPADKNSEEADALKLSSELLVKQLEVHKKQQELVQKQFEISAPKPDVLVAQDLETEIVKRNSDLSSALTELSGQLHAAMDEEARRKRYVAVDRYNEEFLKLRENLLYAAHNVLEKAEKEENPQIQSKYFLELQAYIDLLRKRFPEDRDAQVQNLLLRAQPLSEQFSYRAQNEHDVFIKGHELRIIGDRVYRKKAHEIFYEDLGIDLSSCISIEMKLSEDGNDYGVICKERSSLAKERLNLADDNLFLKVNHVWWNGQYKEFISKDTKVNVMFFDGFDFMKHEGKVRLKYRRAEKSAAGEEMKYTLVFEGVSEFPVRSLTHYSRAKDLNGQLVVKTTSKDSGHVVYLNGKEVLKDYKRPYASVLAGNSFKGEHFGGLQNFRGHPIVLKSQSDNSQMLLYWNGRTLETNFGPEFWKQANLTSKPGLRPPSPYRFEVLDDSQFPEIKFSFYYEDERGITHKPFTRAWLSLNLETGQFSPGGLLPLDGRVQMNQKEKEITVFKQGKEYSGKLPIDIEENLYYLGKSPGAKDKYLFVSEDEKENWRYYEFRIRLPESESNKLKIESLGSFQFKDQDGKLVSPVSKEIFHNPAWIETLDKEVRGVRDERKVYFFDSEGNVMQTLLASRGRVGQRQKLLAEQGPYWLHVGALGKMGKNILNGYWLPTDQEVPRIVSTPVDQSLQHAKYDFIHAPSQFEKELELLSSLEEGKKISHKQFRYIVRNASNIESQDIPEGNERKNAFVRRASLLQEVFRRNLDQYPVEAIQDKEELKELLNVLIWVPKEVSGQEVSKSFAKRIAEKLVELDVVDPQKENFESSAFMIWLRGLGKRWQNPDIDQQALDQIVDSILNLSNRKL